ncbi:cytochrome c [bacterium]|nr:cytochrome c [bacterium]
MLRVTRLAGAFALMVLPLASLAAPVTYDVPDETATFLPGPGVDVAEANCATCHSTDYINYQPPKMGEKFWSGEVAKMIKVYGAPISDADAKVIAAYLAATY